ncbi:hypothetical protein CHCC20335_0977 [Bacillus paralicheniformis]|nr:hypothetical protein CHCC20335_0977 [Bacillus paralicheniformis]
MIESRTFLIDFVVCSFPGKYFVDLMHLPFLFVTNMALDRLLS